MLEVFKNKSITVVANENFGGASVVTDFRQILTKIFASKPEILYVNPTSPRAGGLIIKQARELGFTGAIHANFSIASADSLEVGGKYINGVIISDATELSEKGKDLMEKYTQKYGKGPANEYEMGASYDRLYIIKEVIEKVGYDTEDVKDYLYSIRNYQGSVGTYSFDENGDVVGVGFTNFVLKDGKKEAYKP